jgi:hypothetical protein
MQQGFVRGGPRVLLRIEGLAYIALALIGYAQSGYSWWLFAALILVPDVSMFGYLINPSIGAASYKPCAHAHPADSTSLRGGTIRQYAAPCGRRDLVGPYRG